MHTDRAQNFGDDSGGDGWRWCFGLDNKVKRQRVIYNTIPGHGLLEVFGFMQHGLGLGHRFSS